MARHARRLGATLLLGLSVLLAGACAVEYVPDAQGTPRAVLRAPSTPAPAGLPAAGKTLTPTPTPALRRLTAPGCCSGIGWSADGTRVLYVDKPDERPAALWGVAAATGEQAPYSAVVGALQLADRYVVARQPSSPQSVTVHDRETEARWVVWGVGGFPLVSPDGARIAYTAHVAWQPLAFSRRMAPIMVAALDGAEPRRLTTLYGGGVVDWFPDSSRLLLFGRQDPNTERPSLWEMDAASGALEQLAAAARLRNISLSPDGAWVVFLALFEQDPYRNTTWAVRVDTGAQRRLNFAGTYGWVGGEPATLIYVPPRRTPNEGFSVWKLNVASGERTRLIDPAQTPLFIANGDWALAPDGKRLAFVSAEDYAIWLLVMAP